jgi:hypothetical protein
MNHYGSTQHLGRGWSAAEGAGNRTVRWSNGPVSEVGFQLSPLSTPYTLRLEVHPYAEAMPQAVTVELNGEALATVVPTLGWQQVALFVPRTHLLSGENHLVFRYDRVVRPGDVDGSSDRRQLAMLFDAIDLSPLAAAAEIQMDASDRSWAFAEGWSGFEQIDGRGVRWSDGESSTLRFHLDPISGPYRLQLELLPFEPTLPQAVTVGLNGAVLETLSLGEGWRHHVVDVPAGLLRIEDNELRFEYASALRPSDISGSADRRRLAVLFDSLRLSPRDPS